MSTFSGLNIGLSSLFAQRRGLELTGHNIANANTEGYSRQRVRLQGEGGPITPAVHAVYDGVGNGVSVAGTQRLRDDFLEGRALKERGTDAQLRGGQVVLSRVEGILAEPTDSGIGSQLSEFWSGWDDVANNPTDLAARSQLLERGKTLASGFGDALSRLDAQRASSQEQLAVTVDEVNATARAVAELNRAISSATRAGTSPNDLKDQRDLLVQKLGTLAGATVRSGEDGSVDVVVGTSPGRALVQGRTTAPLTVTTSATGASGIAWADGTSAGAGGEAGGLLTGVNDIVPRYRDGLAAVASRLAEVVNAQHRAGFDQGGTAGGDFFTVTDGRLSVQVGDPAAVAASPLSGGGTGDAGGSNALALSKLGSAEGGPDQAYRSLVVTLGVESQTAIRRVDIQSSILTQVDAAREAEAGVSLDEEMSNMLAYQRAYEGAARFVTSVDQLLDTLINRTGLVGR